MSVRLAVKLSGEMVKLPLRAGAVDRSVWPIAAPLARVAELLRFDLAAVTEAAERVAPYITADGRRLWSVKLIERAIDPNARAWLRRRSGAPAKTPPTPGRLTPRPEAVPTARAEPGDPDDSLTPCDSPRHVSRVSFVRADQDGAHRRPPPVRQGGAGGLS